MSWFDWVLEGFYRIIVLRPPRMSFFCGRVLDGFYKISVLRPSSDELIGRVLDGFYKISVLRPPLLSIFEHPQLMFCFGPGPGWFLQD